MESRKPSTVLIESRSIAEIGRLLEEKESQETIKKGLLAKLRDSDMLDTGLDMLSVFGVGLEAAGGGAAATGVGLVPGAGALTVGATISIVADLINAIRRASRGDYLDAAMYVMFAVPLVGDVLQLGKNSMSLMKILKWMRDSSNSAKKTKILTAAKKLVDLGAEKIPGAEKHREPLRSALESLASGDPKEIAAAAKKSGYEIFDSELQAAVEKSKDKKADREKDDRKKVSESAMKFTTHSRKVVDLYKGILY